MKLLETIFEGALWNSRFVIITAVIGSLLAGFAIFYMATVDVANLFMHAMHYADSGLTDEARKALHDSTVTHIVEVVDGYLLATVMLIFSLGLYELFISDIDQAHGSKASSKISGHQKPGRSEVTFGQSDPDDFDRHPVSRGNQHEADYSAGSGLSRCEYRADRAGAVFQPCR